VLNGVTVRNETIYTQIEMGPTASPYEPYAGEAYEIPLTAPLYGLPTAPDLVRVGSDGKVEAERHTDNVLWKDATTYNVNSTQPTDTTLVAFYVAQDGVKFSDEVKSDRFEEALNSSLSNVSDEIIFAHPSNARIVFTILKSRLSGWSDAWDNTQKAAAMKSWAGANPIAVLYELADPVVTTLDLIQPIPALEGINNVWSDGGGETTVGDYEQSVAEALEEEEGPGGISEISPDTPVVDIEDGKFLGVEAGKAVGMDLPAPPDPPDPPVKSVNEKTGAVVLTGSDMAVSETDSSIIATVLGNLDSGLDSQDVRISALEQQPAGGMQMKLLWGDPNNQPTTFGAQTVTPANNSMAPYSMIAVLFQYGTGPWTQRQLCFAIKGTGSYMAFMGAIEAQSSRAFTPGNADIAFAAASRYAGDGTYNSTDAWMLPVAIYGVSGAVT
jgi:hypothetical protein